MQPTPFGRYLLLERLAVGGTAEIFKAKLIGVEGFEKTVAIKRILPHWSSNPNFIAMLIDEAKIMVRLNHERIVQVHELGKEGDSYYIAMEWVQGTDLRRLTDAANSRKMPLTPEESIHIIAEVLRGLEFIHRQKDDQGRSLSIVHRDISPQNILLSEAGAVKIADFGIAHAASRSYETATGVLKGKFTYMSPEQARGGTLDVRTDIFAAGIIFYELLAGRRLFAGGSDLEILEKVRRFETAQALGPLTADRRLKTILAKALEPAAKNRYSSAHEFWKDLNRAQTDLGLNCDGERLAERIRYCFGENPESKTDSKLRQTLELGLPPSFSSTTLVSKPAGEEETTRSLEDPAFHGSGKRRVAPWLAWSGTLLVLLTFIFLYQGNGKRRAAPEAPPSKIPESQAGGLLSASGTLPSSAPTLDSSASAARFEPAQEKTEMARAATLPEEKTDSKKPAAPAGGSAPSPAAPGKGTLLVRAQPWGKISVSGVVSGSERPVSRTLAYGNYQISVAFQDLNGQWKTVFRSVKIAKASTVCNASFHPDGKGSISCH